MKISKDGKIKLEKGEIRVGNFFAKRESGHIRLTDIHGVFSVRFSTRIPAGAWLDALMKLGKERGDSLKAYVATLWSALSVVPDQAFLDSLFRAVKDCLERHRDWYGAAEGDDAEDAKALAQVEEFMAAKEDMERQLGEVAGDVD